MYPTEEHHTFGKCRQTLSFTIFGHNKIFEITSSIQSPRRELSLKKMHNVEKIRCSTGNTSLFRYNNDESSLLPKHKIYQRTFLSYACSSIPSLKDQIYGRTIAEYANNLSNTSLKVRGIVQISLEVNLLHYRIRNITVRETSVLHPYLTFQF